MGVEVAVGDAKLSAGVDCAGVDVGSGSGFAGACGGLCSGDPVESISGEYPDRPGGVVYWLFDSNDVLCDSNEVLF